MYCVILKTEYRNGSSQQLVREYQDADSAYDYVEENRKFLRNGQSWVIEHIQN